MRPLLFCCLLALGCQPTRFPEPPPPTGPGDCSTALATLTGLGGCGLDLGGFVPRCLAAQKAEAGLGVTLDVACLTRATDCSAARACR